MSVSVWNTQAVGAVASSRSPFRIAALAADAAAAAGAVTVVVDVALPGCCWLYLCAVRMRVLVRTNEERARNSS